MLNLKFAETHTPLFLCGINLGTKLDPAKRQELHLQYDPKKEFLLVWLKGQLSLVPKETVVSMVPMKWNDLGYACPSVQVEPEPVQSTASPNPKIQAQVSTPHSHLHELGQGQTGLGARVK